MKKVIFIITIILINTSIMTAKPKVTREHINGKLYQWTETVHNGHTLKIRQLLPLFGPPITTIVAVFDPNGVLTFVWQNPDNNLKKGLFFEEINNTHFNDTKLWVDNDVLYFSEDISESLILLYNIQGQRVLQIDKQGNSNNVNISDLKSGIYFCLIQSNGKKIHSKIINKESK